MTALSAAATIATHLSGIADETSDYLTITQSGVSMWGLLLAGIVIGSLGVLDGVAVPRSATVSELACASSTYRSTLSRPGSAAPTSPRSSTPSCSPMSRVLPLMLLLSAGNPPAGELLTEEISPEPNETRSLVS
jgi:hypothetical protein